MLDCAPAFEHARLPAARPRRVLETHAAIQRRREGADEGVAGSGGVDDLDIRRGRGEAPALVKADRARRSERDDRRHRMRALDLGDDRLGFVRGDAERPAHHARFVFIDAEIIDRADQFGGQRPRRRRVEHHLGPAPPRRTRRRFDLGDRRLALQQHPVALGERDVVELSRARVRVGARGDDDGVLAALIDDDERRSGRLVDLARCSQIYAVATQQRERRVREFVRAISAHQGHLRARAPRG